MLIHNKSYLQDNLYQTLFKTIHLLIHYFYPYHR